MENSITITMIFEGSALNRNEKIGGNILSVKKLNVNGVEKTYISKVAIRHYLFTTLINAFAWKEAKISNDGNVLQFDISKDDIISCEELDVFGYMNTHHGQTRKSPLHITKAVSISAYEQDMGMYANHDLVRRAKEQGDLDINVNPDPYNKEEHTSLFKLTFTIDTKKLGYDKWVIKGKIEFDSEKGKLKIGETRVIQNVNKINDNEYEVIGDSNNVTGKITISELKKGEYYKVEFFSNKKSNRIEDLLTTIHNGLVAHSSGESNTIVPLFLIAGKVRVPSPVFHSFIDVKRKNDGTFEVIGINDALKNSWLEGKVYIFDSERVTKQAVNNQKIIYKNNWENFINSINSSSNENDSNNTGK